VNYRIADGSYFRPTCFRWHDQGPFPATELIKGSFKGTGTADSPRQGGMTREAVMYGASGQEVKYTIKRRLRRSNPDGTQGITTLIVTSGGTMSVGLPGAGSCRPGEKMVINWRGEVRNL
jgi:hypothetical protein